MRSKKKRGIRSKMTLQEGGKDEALVIAQILTSRSAQSRYSCWPPPSVVLQYITRNNWTKFGVSKGS